MLITNNELDHLTLGCSESLSINGNVDGGKQLLIEQNLVHHADLGIEVASEQRDADFEPAAHQRHVRQRSR